MADARDLASTGEYERAIERVNGLMGVESAEALPETWDAFAALAALERAVLLQAVGDWERSARDLSAAEERLEFLEIDLDALGELGQYLYSDAAQPYQAWPVERVSVNAFNMLNYLARGRLEGAAVEARRYQVMREFLETEEAFPRVAFGAYLAGFVFEQRGEGDRALRYYEEALEAGELATLDPAIRRLASRHGFRGPGIEEVLERSGGAPGPERGADVLVVVAPGRVPHKVPERMPLGLAIGLGATWVTGDTDVLERSALKVVVYPELSEASEVARSARVSVDGRELTVDLVTDLGDAVRREYRDLKPRIIGAALTRLVARAAAAEGTRAAVGASGADDVWGLLAALLVEGALVSLDEPDTRSWTLLPDRVYAARARLAPGEHLLQVRISGLEGTEIPLLLEDEGFAVVVVTEPR